LVFQSVTENRFAPWTYGSCVQIGEIFHQFISLTDAGFGLWVGPGSAAQPFNLVVHQILQRLWRLDKRAETLLSFQSAVVSAHGTRHPGRRSSAMSVAMFSRK
jgi:hypothetical protein